MNVGLVPDAYLDMGFSAKTRIGVDVLSFSEDSANRIEGLLVSIFSRFMQIINHGTVEFAKTKIRAADVLWYLSAGGAHNGLEACVGRFNCMDAIGTDEVETESGVDHRTDNEWLSLPAFIFPDSFCPIVGPFKSSIRIRFPKINA